MTSLMAVSAIALPSLSANAETLTGNDIAASHEFTITKDIVLFNVDASKIYEPNVEYSYSVGPVTVGDNVTITDGNNNVVAVRSGIPNAVKIKGNLIGADYDSITTLTFGADTKVNSNDEGSEVTTDSKHVDENLNIKIDADKIYGKDEETHNPPGVYRYKITDTTASATLTAAGIQRHEDYNEDIYLDVYTKYNSNKDGLVVYGYTLFRSTTTGTETTNTTSITTESEKITGYDVESETLPSSGVVSGGTIISDQYHTYNVEIKKAVAGDLGDTANEFPFQIELSDGKANADFYWIQSGDTEKLGTLGNNGALVLGSANSATDPVTSAVTPPSSTINLKHGESCTITGLPTGTKVKVSEYNNTGDTYTVDVKKNNVAVAISNEKMAKGVTASMSEKADVNKTESGDVIIFTNTLSDISVTGLFLNIAPFIFITAAGVVLITLFMRNKKKDNSDNMI